MGNPTLADAILDRVIHNAYRIELAGESMRKRRMLESQGILSSSEFCTSYGPKRRTGVTSSRAIGDKICVLGLSTGG